MPVDPPPASLTITSLGPNSTSIKASGSDSTLDLPLVSPLSPLIFPSSDPPDLSSSSFSSSSHEVPALAFPKKPPGPSDRRPPRFPPNPIPNSIWRAAPNTPPTSRLALSSKKVEAPMKTPTSNTQVTNITYLPSSKPKSDPYPFPPLTRSPNSPEAVAELRTFIHQLLGKNQPPPSTRHVQLPGEEKARKPSITTTSTLPSNHPRKAGMAAGSRKSSLMPTFAGQGPSSGSSGPSSSSSSSGPSSSSSDPATNRSLEQKRIVSMSATSKDTKLNPQLAKVTAAPPRKDSVKHLLLRAELTAGLLSTGEDPECVSAQVDMYQKILDQTSQSRDSISSLPKRTGVREAGIGAPTLVMTSSRMVKELPMGSRAQTTNQILRSRKLQGSSGMDVPKYTLEEKVELTERERKRLSRAEKILGKDAVEAAVQARASMLLNNPPSGLPSNGLSSSSISSTKGHRRTDSLGRSDSTDTKGMGSGSEGGRKKGGWKHLFQKKPSISLGSMDTTGSVGTITMALSGKDSSNSGDIISPTTRGRAGTFPLRSHPTSQTSSPPPTKVSSQGHKTTSRKENGSSTYPLSLSLEDQRDTSTITSPSSHRQHRRKDSGGSISDALDYFHGTSPPQRSPRSPKSPGKGKESEGEERGRGRRKKRSSSSMASLSTSSSGSSERLSQTSPIPPRPVRQVPLPPKYPTTSSPDLKSSKGLEGLGKISPPSSVTARSSSGDHATSGKAKGAQGQDRRGMSKDRKVQTEEQGAEDKERFLQNKVESRPQGKERRDQDQEGYGSSKEDEDKVEDTLHMSKGMGLPNFLPPLAHPPPTTSLPPIPGQGLGDIGLMGGLDEDEKENEIGKARAHHEELNGEGEERDGVEKEEKDEEIGEMPPPLSPMPPLEVSGEEMHKLLMKKHLGIDVAASYSVRRESDTLSPTTVISMFKSKGGLAKEVLLREEEEEDDGMLGNTMNEHDEYMSMGRKGSLLRSEHTLFSDEDEEDIMNDDDPDDAEDLLDDVLGIYQDVKGDEGEKEDEDEEEEEREEKEESVVRDEEEREEDEDEEKEDILPRPRSKRLSSITPIVGVDTSFLENMNDPSGLSDTGLGQPCFNRSDEALPTLSPSPISSPGAEIEGKGKMAPPSTPSGILSPVRTVSPDIDRAVQARQAQILPSKAITPRFPTIGSVRDRVKAIEKVKVEEVAIKASSLTDFITRDEEPTAVDDHHDENESLSMETSVKTDSGVAEEEEKRENLINQGGIKEKDVHKESSVNQETPVLDYSDFDLILDQESQNFLKSLTKSMEAFDRSHPGEGSASSGGLRLSGGTNIGDEDEGSEDDEDHLEDENDEDDDEDDSILPKGRRMRWNSVDGARMLKEMDEAIDVHTVAEEVRASALPHNRRGRAGSGMGYGDFLSPQSAEFDVSVYGLTGEEEGESTGLDTEDEEEHLEELMRQLTSPRQERMDL